MPHRVVGPGWSALVILLLAACGPGRPATTDSLVLATNAGAPSTSAAATKQGAPDTVATATAAIPAAAPAAVSASACPPLTPAVITAGQKIFTGAGNCFTCHGANAAGTAMAPSLHAHQWLNISA